MKATASLNTKIDMREKTEFQANTEALGMSPSAAIKIFVRMFNEYKGFPFDVRLQPKINYENPNISRATMKNDTVVVPTSWKDDDE